MDSFPVVYSGLPGKNLVIGRGGEIEAEPIQRFFNPNGKPAYEVFETNR
jgi:hypothetical protein